MSPVETGQMSAAETGQMSSVETGQMTALEAGQISSDFCSWEMPAAETRQMSAVETGQMFTAETGQMCAVETRQMYSIKTGQRPVAIVDICLVSTADICPVSTADISISIHHSASAVRINNQHVMEAATAADLTQASEMPPRYITLGPRVIIIKGYISGLTVVWHGDRHRSILADSESCLVMLADLGLDVV